MCPQHFKHAFSVDELYIGLNKKLLRGRKLTDLKRKKLASNIFHDCFYEILLDIIENNSTFVLPLRYGNYAEICMKQYSQDEFKDLYTKGKFNDIDFVLSQFTGNQLVFNYKTRLSSLKEKPIYVNKYLKKRILENTNSAKQYY